MSSEDIKKRGRPRKYNSEEERKLAHKDSIAKGYQRRQEKLKCEKSRFLSKDEYLELLGHLEKANLILSKISTRYID